MNRRLLILAIIIVFILIIISLLFYNIRPTLKQDPIRVQCQYFCDTGQEEGFCNFKIRTGDGISLTCAGILGDEKYSKYGVQSCPSISCKSVVAEEDRSCVSGLGGIWVDPQDNGECPSRENKFSIRRIDHSDDPPKEGQICCFYYE
ncbi:MAG: hypothetical protein QXU40_00585 [Candidatus Pacearchaeota archaeon]